MLLICEDCTARYAVGALRCPQCQSTRYREEGTEMPKVTVHSGPSVADEETVVQGKRGPELVAVTEAPAEDTEGSEESSPGNSSATSSEKESTSPEQSEKPSPSTARKTANRSK